jgi:ABC transporter related protein
MEESALMVRGLCRQQGKFELRDISFTLPRGYIMGLVGRMGSGKTTLLKSILNPSLIKSGSVEYEGQAGFIMEDAPFFAEATLKENMDVFKNLYKNYDEKEFYERLKRVGLEDHKVYGLLSKGEKVRFQFAFAMGHHPRLLLLDEPTSGLDVTFRREFLYMLQEAVEKQMISVIFSTHLTDELKRIADFIGIMDNGTLTMKENTASDTQIQDIETWGSQPRNVEPHNGKADNSEGKGIAVNDGGGDDDRADSGNDSRDNGRSAGRNKRLHRGAAPELKGMLRFCRGVYLKNSFRFAAYILCVMQFTLGWIVFVAEDEWRMAAGVITGMVITGVLFQYLGSAMQVDASSGNRQRMVFMHAGRFFGLNPLLLWTARMLCTLRNSLCFTAVALVQYGIAAAVSGNPVYMLVLLEIAAGYAVIAVLSAIMTFIEC